MLENYYGAMGARIPIPNKNKMEQEEKELLLEFLSYLEEETIFEPLSFKTDDIAKEKQEIIENFEITRNA